MIEELFNGQIPTSSGEISTSFSTLCCCECKCRVTDPKKDDANEDFRGEGKVVI